MTPSRRSTDVRFLCRIANAFGMAWDFIDERDIDKHLVGTFTLYVTWWITKWATVFTELHPEKSGLEIAAIIAAVLVPWTPLQAKVIQWWFEARTK